MRAEFPAYAALHAHVLQDVLARLEKRYHAFFPQGPRGETAGCPRFTGKTRCHAVTVKEDRTGVQVDHGVLVLSKLGRMAVRWSRPREGTPTTVTLSQEADGDGDGDDVAISWAEVPVKLRPATGRDRRRASTGDWTPVLPVPLGSASSPPAGSARQNAASRRPSGV